MKFEYHFVCFNCGRPSIAGSTRAVACKRPECRKALKARHREQQAKYRETHRKRVREVRREWKRKNKLFPTHLPYNNWCFHHYGDCFRCLSPAIQLNRFGLCLNCFKLSNSDMAGPDWKYDAFDNDELTYVGDLPFEREGV
jgi:hypothetical protein